MSRVTRFSTFANGMRPYAIYFCAMGGLGVSAVYAAHTLSDRLWHAAVANSADTPRGLSRVEKYFIAKSNIANRALPGPYRPVVALVKPSIHPGVLAAAMDRTELASAYEHPEHHAVVATSEPATSSIDLASWRQPAVQVAGLACLETGCRDSADIPPSIDQPTRGTAVDIEAAKIADNSVITEDAAALGDAAAQAIAKPDRLGKGRTVRQKTSRKVVTQFFGIPEYPGLRVAETPGDIISRTLRGMI